MASEQVIEIIDQVLNTFDDAYGGVFIGVEGYDLNKFASEYFEWLDADLRKHYHEEVEVRCAGCEEFIPYTKIITDKNTGHRYCGSCGESHGIKE